MSSCSQFKMFVHHYRHVIYCSEELWRPFLTHTIIALLTVLLMRNDCLQVTDSGMYTPSFRAAGPLPGQAAPAAQAAPVRPARKFRQQSNIHSSSFEVDADGNVYNVEQGQQHNRILAPGGECA